MRAVRQQLGRQSGIALLTALLMLLLLSSMLVGFMLLVTSGQRSSGMDNDYNKAFYGAEAGMEKITAELGTLFSQQLCADRHRGGRYCDHTTGDPRYPVFRSE